MRSRWLQRLLLVLGLLAAGSATPLRLAEAASDLSRTLAELADGAGSEDGADVDGSNVEPADGGVGDDPALGLAAADPLDLDPAAADLLGQPLDAGPLGPIGADRHAPLPPTRAGPAPRFPRAGTLHGWLQRFRF